MESTREKAFGAVRTGDVEGLAALLAADPLLAAARDENGVSLRLQAIVGPTAVSTTRAPGGSGGSARARTTPGRPARLP